jgi:ankyrin repeat protein
MNLEAYNTVEDSNGKTSLEVVDLTKAKRRWNQIKNIVKTLKVGRRDLFKAVDLQDEERIIRLLKNDMSYKEENMDKEMPIHRAVENRLLQSLKILVNWKDSVNLSNSEGKTPLHFAMLRGWSEGIDLLLENGADIRAKTSKGDTTLHIAAAVGNLPLLDDLLSIFKQVTYITFFSLSSVTSSISL